MGRPHSPDVRARVLEEFSACGRIDKACEIVGVTRNCHYDWLKTYPEYRAAYEAAIAPVARMLEDVAVCRAVEGWDEPISIGGKRELVRKFDNRLLEFLLQARNPRVFGRKQEITGQDGEPLGGKGPLVIEIRRLEKPEGME